MKHSFITLRNQLFANRPISARRTVLTFIPDFLMRAASANYTATVTGFRVIAYPKKVSQYTIAAYQ